MVCCIAFEYFVRKGCDIVVLEVGMGAYDKKPKMEMVTIVDKHEYKQLMDYIRKIDPKAFVTVYSVSDMRYQPKIK